ncbi:MAG: hypothetical protein LBU34_14335 [Planctomycetaceae bacterium]|jgi:hypothetical protein|nr:hypothetical protein [Planctomycetaceae bacterium]
MNRKIDKGVGEFAGSLGKFAGSLGEFAGVVVEFYETFATFPETSPEPLNSSAKTTTTSNEIAEIS